MSVFVVAAGGTGGHMVPAHVLAGELRARGHEVHLVTDDRGLRFPGLFEGVPSHIVPSGTPGRGGMVRAIFNVLKGRAVARRLFRDLKPAAVIGFGGYPALPALLGALSRGIPTMLHEQNAVLGRVNRLLAGRVRVLATSYANTQRVKRAVEITGNPVRDEIVAVGAEPYPALDYKIELLVIGGSQGATILSRVVPAAIGLLPADLRNRLHIVQQCRAEDIETVRDLYEGQHADAVLESYFADFPARLAASHLVIARSGASTMAELAVAGRPAILVPFAAAMDNHQVANAAEFVAAGGGPLLTEAQFTPEALAAAIVSLTTTPRALQNAAAAAMSVGRPDAGARLATIAIELS